MIKAGAMVGWEEDELEVAASCPVCGGTERTAVYSGIVDLEEGCPGAWSFKSCRDCVSLYLDPRPSHAGLSKAYASYYTHHSPDSENAVLVGDSFGARIARGYLCERYGLPRVGSEIRHVARVAFPLRQQLDYYMRHLPRAPSRLLDVGCGSGGFLMRALAAGWDVEGVEPDAMAANAATKAGVGMLHARVEDVVHDDFSVVTLSHVLEHLHDPKLVLRRIRELLRPGGRLWIAVPNIGGAGRKVYREGWQALEVPRHIALPSARGMIRLLEGCGFNEIRFVRRGRGSAKRFLANEARLQSGGSVLRARSLALAVDAAASVEPLAGEELVVMARTTRT